MSVAADTTSQPPLNSEDEMEANRPLNSNEQHQGNQRKPLQDQESEKKQNTSLQSDKQQSLKGVSGNRKNVGKSVKPEHNDIQHDKPRSTEKKISSDAKRDQQQSSDGKKRALVVIAEGTEESEAVITIDMLRRSGVEVIVAGLDGSDAVSGDNQIRILPDKALEEVRDHDFDAVIIPGGTGVDKISKSRVVKELLKKAEKRNSVIGAICGGPKALTDVCHNCEITCYPFKEDHGVKKAAGKDHKLCLDRIHSDKNGKLITSQAPGTAFEFSNALIKQLCGEKVAHDIMEKMLVSAV